MFKNMYQHMNDTKLQYDEQIQNTQDIAELLNSYIESYKDGTITYQEAMNGMNNLLSKINDKMTALDSLDNVLDYIGTSQDVTGNTQDILDSIKNSLTQTADELLKSFEVYNENSGLITEYTTSWEQLTDNVASIKDILGEVRDNLEDALDELSSIRDETEDSDDDDDDSPHWDDSDAEHGPGIGLSYAKGIENGLVGSNNNGDREAKLKLMGLRELDEDEVKAILHKGEAVFNPEQQSKLLSNFETAYNAAIPKISMPTIPELKTFNPANTITITVGDINLPDVTDVDGFAKAMGSRFGTLLNQEIGRNIK